MNDTPATFADLARVTGLNRNTVAAYVRAGQLPGYVLGGGGKPRYVIPRQLFEDFCAGRWEPAPRPLRFPAGTVQLLHRKEA